MENDFFTKQILTYLGNKRKFLTKIEEIIQVVKVELGEKNINIAEGFSGSGVVSRLFKNRVMSDYKQPLKNFYVNDIAGYSNTLNKCYLTSSRDLNTDDYAALIYHMKRINAYINNLSKPPKSFISKYWAPKNDKDIQVGERVYFTQENALIVDKMMSYIMTKIDLFLDL